MFLRSLKQWTGWNRLEAQIYIICNRMRAHPIFSAITSHNLEGRDNLNKVIQMVSSDPSVLTKVNAKGYTPLVHAIIYNKPDIIEALINAGADVNLETGIPKAGWNNIYTPLEYAILYDNIDAINMLILKGANIHIGQNNGSALHTLMKLDDRCHLIPILLQAGAASDLNKKNINGYTPLHNVSMGYDCIKQFLDAGANPSIPGPVIGRDADGTPWYGTAAYKAAEYGKEDVLAAMLASPYFENVIEKNGKTLLDLANDGYFAPHINQHIIDYITPMNPNNLPSRTIPRRMPNSANNTQMVPAYNIITGENIMNGNILTNFRGTAPNSFESARGKYYKFGTVRKLKSNPFTREPITNKTHYVARFPPENGTAEGGRRRRLRTRKLKKQSRRSRRRV